MNKEFFKSILLTSLIVLTVWMTKDLLDAKTPDVATQSTINVAKEENVINIDTIIYPQDFVIGFGGGSYTGVYSETTRENIWNITTELLPTYLNSVNVIEEDEFHAIKKTRSIQMKMPFPISMNDLGEAFGGDRWFGPTLNTPIDEMIISTSQKNRLYLANTETMSYFYLTNESEDDRIARLINIVNENNFTEYRRVDSLINFKNIKDEESQAFHNSEIIPITSLGNIPFVKVTKEIDATADRQNSEVKNFLNKAFGSSTDFIKRLEEMDGSQSYIYGYGDKALRLGIDGRISYQEKLSATTQTEEVNFKEGLEIALHAIDGFGSSPQSLYLSNYETYDEADYNIKTYTFNYRVKDMNVFTKGMADGDAVRVVLKNDVVTEFTKNIRRYVKSIDASEIWTSGPMYVESLINENFAIVSKNFNEDMDVDFRDEEGNWQMTTYVLSIMQNLKNVELYYYLDSELDAERLVPAWRVEIADTLYYFHLYTGDVLYSEKTAAPKLVEVSRR
jgi:hypothetical protein